MRLIVEARGNTPFADLFDLARRVELKRVGKRPMEMLARAGALDALERNRRRTFEGIDALIEYSTTVHDQRKSSQDSLFGEAGEDLPGPRLPSVDDWSPAERLTEEFGAVGFYLSGHPLDEYMPALRRRKIVTLAEMERRVLSAPLVARLAGTVSGLRERKSSRGNRFAIAHLSDPTGFYEVMIYSETLEVARKHLEAGSNVVFNVAASMDGGRLKLLAHKVQPVDEILANAGGISGLRIFLNDGNAAPEVAAVLGQAEARERGSVSIRLTCPDLPGDVEIGLDGDYPLDGRIGSMIENLPGVTMVEEL